MKKRNLIATNCPPGVDCDVQLESDGESEKPGKVQVQENVLFQQWSYRFCDSQKVSF